MGRCSIGESSHDCVEITPLQASGRAYGAIGEPVSDCMGKVLHDGDGTRRISPVGGGLSGGETG